MFSLAHPNSEDGEGLLTVVTLLDVNKHIVTASHRLIWMVYFGVTLFQYFNMQKFKMTCHAWIT